jgi:dinuclear metal center YbgI/SA1388 family protein
MVTVRLIADFLEEFAPSELAEDWDNVGLLVGDDRQQVASVMTCLTITPPVIAEAVEHGAGLIVAHHPLPFRALKRLTRESHDGGMLLDLIAAGIAVYSPHTAFDSAQQGINQQLADGLQLVDAAPLVPGETTLGSGRWGTLRAPISLGELAQRAKTFLRIDGLHLVGEPDRPVTRVAVACGSAGELLDAARQQQCDALLLGETQFHTCLEAEAAGIGLVLAGHYASERFAVQQLAVVLAEAFADTNIWASRVEQDPLSWV